MCIKGTKILLKMCSSVQVLLFSQTSLGSADTSVSMFDHHNLTSGGVGLPIYKFEGHKAAVLCWSPDRASIFGGAVEDGFLNIWDHEKVFILLFEKLLNNMNLVWKLFNNFYKNWALKSVAAPNPSLEFIYIIFRLGCKKKEHAGTRVPNSPPGLFFRHSGHRYINRTERALASSRDSILCKCRDKVVDFHWNVSDPWTIVNISDDCSSTGGGGTGG
ncbi:hypothetical protein BHM03_00051322 [Ensete ventricosum]|uniref:Anaphase-promoting complex subunit 4 WD40 domain-containing protein n=1 Tax=Ensete ventricosum TaxID=4639 RepID=A0A445MM08_ENSVE|nr:hypothetical protein BHM03_00051322 [Ensete ventricosum]